MTTRTYKPKTYHQAATVVLETAVAEAVAVLRAGMERTSLRRFDSGGVVRTLTNSYGTPEARRILLAAATTAEALLGRTSS